MPTLTHVPLPTVKNLMAALVNPSLPDHELAVPWCSSGDSVFWFSRSAWSLMAIAQWRQRLTGQSSISVWLPDFFCNASLVPLRDMGAKLQFYPLTDQMAPDQDACRVLADEIRPDLFVLVHFFGQPSRAEGATSLCRETGAWLIEDAAHVLRPVTSIGEHGDCVLYSPHKCLPVPDGAVLIVRKNGPARLAHQTSNLLVLKEIYCSLLDSPGFSHRFAGLWLVKRVLQGLGMRARRRPIIPFFMDAAPAGPRLEHPKMSPMARRLLSGLLDTLDTVAYLRQQNSMLWDQVLAKAKFQPRVRIVSDEFTPYLADFAFDDVVQAEKIFLQWQRNGLPVTTWPDLPPEVSGREDRSCTALQLRRTRIYLPVHQTLVTRQIIACGQRLSRRGNG